MLLIYFIYMFFTKKEVPPPRKIPLYEIIFYMWLIFTLLKYISKYQKSSEKKEKTDDEPLKNVIGLESVKEEIKYYMDFINNKDKYNDWDVKLPKGILLAGPPGTGKTLLVKTMAEDLDIPIESMCGSEFVEMYVGVGASRVRKLFKNAKNKEKCIIFIDEIDAVGKKRGYDRNSERDNTLNQLLVEMDGFDVTDNIIVFAATNLVKNLDPALTRSGRFDKKVYFDPPNFKERKEMFKLYFDEITLPSNLSFEILSERSAGLTGADIANVCNQSKINAIQANQPLSSVRDNDIQQAIDEVMIGREKRERTMSIDERKRVSFHEAGHALMGYILKYCTHPVKVSIVPRGEAALGYSQQKTTNQKLYSEESILSQIAVCLGGRISEYITFGNVSTGASDDIEKASNLVYKYCCIWGMSKEIGPINPTCMGIIGENISDNMFEECAAIIKHIETIVEKYLRKHKTYIKNIAMDLLENETINYERIIELVPPRFENSLEISL